MRKIAHKIKFILPCLMGHIWHKFYRVRRKKLQHEFQTKRNSPLAMGVSQGGESRFSPLSASANLVRAKHLLQEGVRTKCETPAQRGFLMIAAIVLIMIFAVIGVVATYLVNTDILSGANQLSAQQAFYIAESGLEAGTHQLSIPTIANRTACASITGHANLTNYTFSSAKGPFTVTGTGPQSPTVNTLSSAVTASATTIPINSTATYAAMGRIMIDHELIDYPMISGNNFINVRRGVAGTTAAAHASGTAVGQYQCLLQSQGGVPTLSPAGNIIGGGRTLQEAVQLPEAWSVGASGSVIRWNNPTEKQWTSTPISGVPGTLNAVFALSYADAWAVGDFSGADFTMAHWNGSSWSAVSGPLPPARNLFGIYCTASDNCEAVGANRTMLIWNGSSWITQSTASIPNTTYNSVFCNTASDCWAVGNEFANQDAFAHWNGSAWSQDPSTPSPSEDLNSVWCNSANDCWAVGNSSAFVRWNGATWSAQSVSGLPVVNYRGVTCVNSNDCWAVGDNSSGSVTVHWNGSAWSRDTSPTTSVDLYGVHCTKTDSCWAVGDSSTTLYWDGINWTDISNPLGSVVLRSVSEIGAKTQPISTWKETFP